MRTWPVGIMLTVVSLSLFSCGGRSGPQAGKAGADTGRPETRAVKALDAVGQDGSQVRARLDATLDKNEQRNKEIEAAGQ